MKCGYSLLSWENLVYRCGGGKKRCDSYSICLAFGGMLHSLDCLITSLHLTNFWLQLLTELTDVFNVFFPLFFGYNGLQNRPKESLHLCYCKATLSYTWMSWMIHNWWSYTWIRQQIHVILVEKTVIFVKGVNWFMIMLVHSSIHYIRYWSFQDSNTNLR